MASFVYDYGEKQLGSWEDGDTHKAMLLRSAYTPVKSSHYVSDIVADEAQSAGYARVVIDNQVRTVNTSSHMNEYSCDEIEFLAMDAGEDLRGMVIYKFDTDDTSSILLFWEEFPSPYTTTGLSLRVQEGTLGYAQGVH